MLLLNIAKIALTKGAFLFNPERISLRKNLKYNFSFHESNRIVPFLLVLFFFLTNKLVSSSLTNKLKQCPRQLFVTSKGKAAQRMSHYSGSLDLIRRY
jgi:hypothetical protein